MAINEDTETGAPASMRTDDAVPDSFFGQLQAPDPVFNSLTHSSGQ